MSTPGKAVSTARAFPKLYNAHKRIQVSRGLSRPQLDFYRKHPLSEAWRLQVSQDVVDFVDKVEARDADGNPQNELLPSEKFALFQNPARYFSRPHNVPDEARELTRFPQFGITLLRTPHLGPRYAQFKVPLWFGKLDLKSYLKQLYNVDVNHIRSFVVHRKSGRREPANRYQRGQAYQPAFKKKMTVELVEPFLWPEELKESELNSSDYQKKSYWDSTIEGMEAQRKAAAVFVDQPDKKYRRSIAQQAKELLAGKISWQPTWQQLPQDVRVLKGKSGVAALPVPGPASGTPSPPR